MAQLAESGVKQTFFSLGKQFQNQYCATSSAETFVREKWGGYDYWDEFEKAGATTRPRPTEEACCKHLISLTTDNCWDSCEFCLGERLLEEAARGNALIAKGDETSWNNLNTITFTAGGLHEQQALEYYRKAVARNTQFGRPLRTR